MHDKARAAASLTDGSNYSRQLTRASKAPEFTTALARWGECLATDLRT